MGIFIRILINTAIGVALIIVWLQFVDIGEILKILKEVKIQYALLLFLFFFGGTVLRAFRLKLLLNQYKLDLKNLVLLNFLSQFFSYIIPLRVGEVTKSVYLHTQLGLPLGKTILWVFIDRFLDFWVTLLLISLLIIVVTTSLPFNFGQIVFAILLGFLFITIIILISHKWAKKILEFFSYLLIFQKLKDIFLKLGNTIIEAFDILRRHPLELGLLLLITVIAIIFDALIWFFLFVSLGSQFDFLKILLGNLLSALTFLIPAAPGYVGSAEASALAVFSGVLGIEPNLTSAAAVLSHILIALAMLIYGIIAIYFLKFDLKLVWEKIFKR